MRIIWTSAALLLAAGCAASTGSSEDPGATQLAASTTRAPSTALRPVGTGPASTAGPTQAESYGGGPVLSAVKVVSVFWGPKVNSTITGDIGGFYSAVTNNEYVDWVDEYYSGSPHLAPIGRGSYAGGFTITPHNTNTSLADSALGVELAAQINAGVLPAPDANTLYMIAFPPGITITDPFGNVSCQEFCAYHESTTQTIHGASTTFSYGVFPDFGPTSSCGTACGTGSMFENFTAAASHEMMESITDPQPFSGWTPEIGDICAYDDAVIKVSSTVAYTVQKIWSNAEQACVASIPNCQGASDTYGITAGVTWGFAPAEVQAWWEANSCNTSPQTSTDLCQKASEIYGISANETWGYAPSSVQSWWVAKGCNTAPLTSDGLCQRASDTYGIVAGVTFGSAPSYVRSAWVADGCNVDPRPETACQDAAERYGIVAGVTFGAAPPEVQSWWSAAGCNSAPIDSACQNASDAYGIVAGSTWGFAPANVQSWWVANGCDTQPASTNACQRASERYGIVGGSTWGFAPANVQSWWVANGCDTRPLFENNMCQLASDIYGIVAGQTFGSASNDVKSWWSASGCTTHPRTLAKHFQ